MIAVSMCSIVMKTSGKGLAAVWAGRVHVTQVPEEHEARCDDIERVQGPYWASRQLKHVDAVYGIAGIGKHEISSAVRAEFLRSRCPDQHGQRAHREQNCGRRSCKHRHG